MAYLKIQNLYRSQEILLFKQAFALEKIDGTSAHLSYKEGKLHFFAGGAKHETFIKIFNEEELIGKLAGIPEVVIFGEAYGGSMQGMSKTYGPNLRFIAFDVKMGDSWLSVPQAEEFVKSIGLEFVHYELTDTEVDKLNTLRDKDSVQAIRNGLGEGRKAEGIILRPLIELRKNNGERLICKHKRDDFRETKTPRVVDSAQLQVLDDAKAIAEEWVTMMRLAHVLDKIPNHSIVMMPQIIKAMYEDIKVEGEGEIVWSKEVDKAIGKTTATLVKQFYQASLVS